MCWPSVIIHKLDGSYLQNSINLSESDYSRSESDSYCFESSSLPSDNLSHHPVIKVLLRVFHAQPLGNDLQSVSNCQRKGKK